jgi:hypothetical protein
MLANDMRELSVETSNNKSNVFGFDFAHKKRRPRFMCVLLLLLLFFILIFARETHTIERERKRDTGEEERGMIDLSRCNVTSLFMEILVSVSL